MRLLVQRVHEAQVDVDNSPFASIGRGFVVLVGFGSGDVQQDEIAQKFLRARMLDKLLGLRVFSDEQGKMNLDIKNQCGEILLVSQFTLYADCRKGRRPSFHPAAPPVEAEKAYDRLCEELAERMPGRVKTGRFGADMNVRLVNWGPVTIMLDSDELC